MLAGRFPFKASTQRELYRRIVRGAFQTLENVVPDARLQPKGVQKVQSSHILEYVTTVSYWCIWCFR